MKDLFSSKEIAKLSGLSIRWIQRLAPELIEQGHAQRVGGRSVYYKSAIDYIKNRPDGRGRPKVTHLRSAGDMGKSKSWRTFCGMTGAVYGVTDAPSEATCKRCLKKLKEVGG